MMLLCQGTFSRSMICCFDIKGGDKTYTRWLIAIKMTDRCFSGDRYKAFSPRASPLSSRICHRDAFTDFTIFNTWITTQTHKWSKQFWINRLASQTSFHTSSKSDRITSVNFHDSFRVLYKALLKDTLIKCIKQSEYANVWCILALPLQFRHVSLLLVGRNSLRRFWRGGEWGGVQRQLCSCE